MISTTVRLHIARSPEDAFTFFTDLRNEPTYNPEVRNVRKTSPGPIGAGTTFEGDHVGFGRVSWRLREFEPPRHVLIEGEVGGSPYRWIGDFSASGNGTEMLGSMQWHPRGVWRVIAPLARVLLAINARLAFRRFKFALESTAHAPRTS